MTKIVTITEEFITLGQFLKHIDVITTGGQANGICKKQLYLSMVKLKIVVVENFMIKHV